MHVAAALQGADLLTGAMGRGQSDDELRNLADDALGFPAIGATPCTVERTRRAPPEFERTDDETRRMSGRGGFSDD